jgi:NADPH:quinone reductase-like Zn-dependent oxidoreductase
MSASFPLVMGADFEGIVRSVGDETTRFAPGDEVFGQVVVFPPGSAGTYASLVPGRRTTGDDCPGPRWA